MNDVTVQQMDEDRFSRAMVVNLIAKRKQIETPSGGIAIRTKHEAEAFLKFKLSYGTPRLNIVTAQLCNAAETTVSLTDRNLRSWMNYPNEALNQFLNGSVIIVDPCKEYPYYDPEYKLKKIQNSPFTPAIHRRFVGDILQLRKTVGREDKGKYDGLRRSRYFDYWNLIDTNTSVRVALIEETLRNELQTGADYGLPPVPLIVSHGTLDIAAKMNDLSKRLWAGRSPCATYFAFESGCLEETSIIDQWTGYLRSTAPGNGESDVVFCKFKDFDLTPPETKEVQRTNYGYFLREVVKLKKESSHRLFVLLEAGFQLYPSLVAGFDVAVTSFTGHEGDSRFSRAKENRGWGGYYDPSRMIHIRFSKDLDLSKRCLCPACEPVKDVKAVTKDYWNFDVCRPHFGMQVNGYAGELRTLIAQRNVQEARRKLEKSDLAILKSLIPDL